MLVYAATDAIITRNILKAIYSRVEPSTREENIYFFLSRLSSVTGIPVPCHLRPSSVPPSPDYPPAYSDSAPLAPSVSLPSTGGEPDTCESEMKRRRVLGPELAEFRRRYG